MKFSCLTADPQAAYPDSELKHVADQLKKAAVTGAGELSPCVRFHS